MSSTTIDIVHNGFLHMSKRAKEILDSVEYKIHSKLKWICRVLEINYPNLLPFDDYEHEDCTLDDINWRVESIVGYMQKALPVSNVPKAENGMKNDAGHYSKLKTVSIFPKSV